MAHPIAVARHRKPLRSRWKRQIDISRFTTLALLVPSTKLSHSSCVSEPDHSVLGAGRWKSLQPRHEVSLRKLGIQSAQADFVLLLLRLQPPEQNGRILLIRT